MSRPQIDPLIWPEVSRCFDQALDLPAEQRPTWLASLPAAVAQVVQRLLQADASTQQPLADSGAVARLAQRALQNLKPGQVIDGYRLLAPLGEGGMAAVWTARQDAGLQRLVALKLPHARGGPQARFAQERDLLSSLEHPHIARLYDAGVAADGQPWLAMEKIEGQPISDWARGQPLKRRLIVCLQVLDAVAFAHQHLVVHCDLKPANILVTADGRVKLLDFGIAQLLGSAAGPGVAFSADSAAPEQLEGAAPATAMDVHALGVLLYELLAGQRPYRLQGADRQALVVARRAWAWQAPSRLAAQTPLAIRPGLDAVVQRAMAVQPQDRYPSVEALRADLLRVMDGEPVQALLMAGAGRLYRLRCWLHRHRLPVLALAAVVLALLLGLAAALWQAREARAQTERAAAVQRLLLQLFQASSPDLAQGRTPSVREVLDQGASRIGTTLADQPGLRASLHLELARIYGALGTSSRALAQARQALQLLHAQGEGDSDEAFDAGLLEAETLKEEAQYEAARAAGLALQSRALAAHGPGHRWSLPLAALLAWIANQQGHAVQAETLSRQGLAAAGPGTDVPRMQLRSVLAHALLDQSRTQEAAATFELLIQDSASLPAYSQTDRLADRYNLARARYLLGEHAEVAALLRALVPDYERHLGPGHDRTLKARGLWAQAESLAGAPLVAVDIQRQTLAVTQGREAFDDSQLSLQRLTLAKLLRQAGRAREGLVLAQAGLQFYDGQQAEPTWLRERGRWILGELLLAEGRLDAALQQFDRAQQQMQRLPGHAQNTLYADLLLSQAMAWQRRDAPGDAARALAAARQALAAQVQAQGARSAAAHQAAAVLAWLRRDAAGLQQAAQAWEGATPLQRAGLGLLRAELLAGSEGAAVREPAAALWQTVLQQPAPARLMNAP